jgi:hypothetical protein
LLASVSSFATFFSFFMTTLVLCAGGQNKKATGAFALVTSLHGLTAHASAAVAKSNALSAAKIKECAAATFLDRGLSRRLTYVSPRSWGLQVRLHQRAGTLGPPTIRKFRLVAPAAVDDFITNPAFPEPPSFYNS